MIIMELLIHLPVVYKNQDGKWKVGWDKKILVADEFMDYMQFGILRKEFVKNTLHDIE